MSKVDPKILERIRKMLALAADNANVHESATAAAMAEKLQTEPAQLAYRRRKWISEPPNGWVKNVLGFRQFSLRGLTKVKAEWRLVCTALNLRRMARMMPG